MPQRRGLWAKKWFRERGSSRKKYEEWGVLKAAFEEKNLKSREDVNLKKRRCGRRRSSLKKKRPLIENWDREEEWGGVA